MRALGRANRFPSSPGQEYRSHTGAEPHAEGGHVGLDHLHGVVDGQPGVDHSPRGVDVELDVLIGVLMRQEQHLGDDQVGDWSSTGVPRKMMRSFSSRE